MTKTSQKRSRSEEEETDDIFPRTKRREFYRNENRSAACEDQPDGGRQTHPSQVASTSTSPLQGHQSHHAPPSFSASLPAGSSAQKRLPLTSADITATLQNTHLDHPGHSHSSGLPPVDEHCPPLAEKETGSLLSLHDPSIGLLPDVVHQTSEEYYSRINRLLRTAHFEKLKRIGDPSLQNANEGDTFH
ncbi:uncharacterized protein [Diadema setosum]|uniref:uncharacterized protein n=1 Tax=Diadema setosum TaxID=31175 RepID=UPI003B3B3A40